MPLFPSRRYKGKYVIDPSPNIMPITVLNKYMLTGLKENVRLVGKGRSYPVCFRYRVCMTEAFIYNSVDKGRQSV